MSRRLPAAPRRTFLVAVAGTATGLVTAGCQGRPAIDRALQLATLDEAMQEVARLAAAPRRRSAATWTWAQTLVHTAQSIEYSMSGFPQAKPALFQHTVGRAAFEVFDWRGRMSHDLAEPIPGAPSLAAEADEAQALARLQAAVGRFRAWTAPLQPHFAYGALDKPSFERAHAMHLAEHLSGFDTEG